MDQDDKHYYKAEVSVLLPELEEGTLNCLSSIILTALAEADIEVHNFNAFRLYPGATDV